MANSSPSTINRSPRDNGYEDEHVGRTVKREQKVTFLACLLGAVASIGGFMFGYVRYDSHFFFLSLLLQWDRGKSDNSCSGQISGFFLMKDYSRRFGQLQPDGSFTFSAARQGTIVGMLSVGCLIGALISGKLADVIGRKFAISAAALWAWVGTIIEISSSSHWVQFAMGRFTTGISIGALSVLVPMYQSESSPAILRGVIVACYQLFVTLGIWTAEMVDWGTESRSDSASWRIPNGLTFLWALLLASGILFLPESPRYAYRKGRVEEARYTIAGLAGADPHSITVTKEMQDIQAKLDEENAATKTHWYEIFTGPRMFYRTILGIVLQAGQQLCGVNYFFYYGTTAFQSTGISNSYTTQLILGSVNVICTIAGLYIVANVGRRKALMAGAAWMMMCFL